MLCHITSLPGSRGIGTLGGEARAFAELLKRAGVRYWQILPLGPVERHTGYSPYASPSAFAGNWMIISLEDMAAESWCGSGILPPPIEESYFVDFQAVEQNKRQSLERACDLFFKNASDKELACFESFSSREGYWLRDYSIYAAVAETEGTGDWLSWPSELSLREPKAMKRCEQELKERIRFHQFVQFQFFKQWAALKEHCAKNGISIIGDIPIYVILEGADAWSNPDILMLDRKTHRPLAVAGVPPDYFSDTGQRWGNPLYRWHDGRSLAKPTLRWWEARIRHLSRLVDIIRIDHFRGFEAFWSIPPDEPTAVHGMWVKGPGKKFFVELMKRLGSLNLIAEDLGVITPEVELLRDELRLPGMKVLQFAFDQNNKNYYLPHNISNPNCVLYTGTHDNNTINGWFYGTEISDETRAYILEYLGHEDWSEFHWKLIRVAYQSVADLIVIPVQDIPGFGGEYRMNTPGTIEGNWRFKLTSDTITEEMIQRLRRMGELYNRQEG